MIIIARKNRNRKPKRKVVIWGSVMILACLMGRERWLIRVIIHVLKVSLSKESETKADLLYKTEINMMASSMKCQSLMEKEFGNKEMALLMEYLTMENSELAQYYMPINLSMLALWWMLKSMVQTVNLLIQMAINLLDNFIRTIWKKALINFQTVTIIQAHLKMVRKMEMGNCFWRGWHNTRASLRMINLMGKENWKTIRIIMSMRVNSRWERK